MCLNVAKCFHLNQPEATPDTDFNFFCIHEDFAVLIPGRLLVLNSILPHFASDFIAYT